MKTICLNMIVKNESRIIKRVLDSVIDLIDCFCIIDTGSTDDTVQKIMNYFKGIPKWGKLGFITFENFEKTRNEAFQMCKGMSDYVLFLDADMVLKHSIDKNKLDKDYYAFFQETDGIRYHNTRLVKNDDNFYYRGVTHEVILSKGEVEGKVLKDDIAKLIDLLAKKGFGREKTMTLLKELKFPIHVALNFNDLQTKLKNTTVKADILTDKEAINYYYSKTEPYLIVTQKELAKHDFYAMKIKNGLEQKR